jgi:hypothetical protein
MSEYIIPGEVRATKSELLEILSIESISFIDWINDSNDIDAVRIKTMLNMVEYINMDSPLVTSYIIPLLLSKGVITNNTISKIESYKQFKTTHHF